MAIQKIHSFGVTDIPHEYSCEESEIGNLPTDVPAHSTCWVLDAKYGLIFDGTAWRGL